MSTSSSSANNNHSQISIENVSVKYPGSRTKALDGITFTVNKGTITAIVGPNGSGKSTLIKAILGLVAYRGKIHLNGKRIEELYGMVGYVPQRPQFDFSFPITAREFLSLALVTCKDSPKDKQQRIRSVLSKVDLSKAKDQLISQLSGGQLQRLLLARALVHSPEVLVLDEPEAGVDVQGEKQFYELLSSIVRDQNITVLIASHDFDVVFAHADQVICINKTLVCRGTPDTIFTEDTFRKLYGSEIKLFSHHTKHNHE